MDSLTTYHLTIPATTMRLADVRKFVEKHGKEHGFSEAKMHDVRLAVDEAVTNIIKHAYNRDETKKIDIELEINTERLCVTLTDTGKVFKIKSLKQPDVLEYARQKRRGGMGVYLIHTLMDNVDYFRNKGKNEIKMCKNRG